MGRWVKVALFGGLGIEKVEPWVSFAMRGACERSMLDGV
jgi:hypothetical protein